MEKTSKRVVRTKIPIATQVHVLFRDGWICHWCHRPTIFAPALKYVERLVEDNHYQRKVAYYDLRYRRDRAPLLDHLAAVIDHIQPYSKGGSHNEENLVTACNKCNARKSDRPANDYAEENPEKHVKSRYGEPRFWDGLASLFVIIGQQKEKQLTLQEREWLREIRAYLASHPTPEAA